MNLGSLKTIRSYLETISRLRNHQSSGVKVHSTGNLHLPRVAAKPRRRQEGDPVCESLRRVGFEKGVHRIPGHFDDAKIPIETNSGRLAPCTTAEAAEKGGEQVMARCWLWYPGSCRVAPGPCSTPKGSCVSQYDDTESNQYPFPSIASQEIPLDIFLGWIYRAYADDSVSSSLRRL